MQRRATQWVVGNDTGTSSKTIWAVMMGAVVGPHQTDFNYSVPCDPADFGRCYRLLQLIPEWKENLRLVGETFPAWKPLVDAWDELEALYEEEHKLKSCPKLYARIQELNDEGRTLDGWKRTGENGWRRE